jgi:hypothetical protein
VLGLTVLQGGVSVSLLAGIALSNLPEGMSSSSGLKAAGWPRDRVLLMWSAVVLVSAVAAAAGYAMLDPASGRTGALVQAFAGGALLAMLADTLLPEAYAVEGVLTGPLVVAGFAVSLALSAVWAGDDGPAAEVLRWVHLLAWRLPPARARTNPWLVLGLVGGLAVVFAGSALAEEARADAKGLASELTVILTSAAVELVVLWERRRPAGTGG